MARSETAGNVVIKRNKLKERREKRIVVACIETIHLDNLYTYTYVHTGCSTSFRMNFAAVFHS